MWPRPMWGGGLVLFIFLAFLARMNDNGEQFNKVLLLQHNSFTCLLLCAPWYYQLNRWGPYGQYWYLQRKDTLVSFICKLFSHQS